MKVEEFDKVVKTVINTVDIRGAFMESLQKPHLLGCFEHIALLAMLHGVDVKKIAEKTLLKKGVEYSANSDRLSNFKTSYNKLEPIKVLEGYALKHLLWCEDFLEGHIEGNKKQIAEHFGDLYNYMILASAILTEKTDEKDIK